MIAIKKTWEGTSFGPVVKNLPANAGDTGWISGSGTKMPPATGQLSLCATATEPTGPEAHALQQEKPPQLENGVHHN